MANGYDQITIQSKVFRVPIKYAAGHVLKDNEAGALNQTFHENLRNNFASKVRDGVEAGLDDQTLQQQLDDYASTYEFGVRGAGGTRGDPVITLAMNLARELIRRAIKNNKLNEEDWPATRVTQAARQLLDSQGDDGSLVKTARRQVEAEKAAAESAMKEAGEVINLMGSAPAGAAPA
jgi:hypothetical protein